MTKEEYFNKLQKMFGDDFDKLGITMSLPKSVMKRNAEKYLESQIEQNQKRLTSRGYISALRDTALGYIGKTFKSSAMKLQLGMEKNNLSQMNYAKKIISVREGASFDEIIQRVPAVVFAEFRKTYGLDFDEKYEDEQKLKFLNSFIDKSIKRLEKKIQIHSAFGDKRQELKKLNGILLDKSKSKDSILPVAMKSPEYQKIMTNIDIAQKAFDIQEEKYQGYLTELNELNAGQKNREIRNRISELEGLVDSVKLNRDEALKNLEEFEQERKDFELGFAETQNKKAKEKSILKHNSSHDVLDDYIFSKNGEPVEAGSSEARQINFAVNEFMSRFRHDIDMTMREYENTDAKIFEYLQKVLSKLKDDLGIQLNLSRSIQRAFDSRAKELRELTGNPKLAESLILSKTVFKNNYDSLKKDLSKIGIDIKNIERRTSKN